MYESRNKPQQRSQKFDTEEFTFDNEDHFEPGVGKSFL